MKTNYKNIIKCFLIFILIIVLFYLLYKCNKKNILEFFSNNTIFNNIDCSVCEVKPTDGDCVTLYDIDYNTNLNTNLNTRGVLDKYGKINLNLSLIDTSYIFCPWKPKCDLSNNFVSRYTKNGNITSVNNITCCSGETWYDTNTLDFQNIVPVNQFKDKCNNLKTKIDLLMNNNKNRFDLDMLKTIYFRIKSKCNEVNDVSNSKGLLFRRELSGNSIHILEDSNLTIEEIIDLQARLNVNYNYPSSNSVTKNNELKRITDLSINNLNQQLYRFPHRKLELQRKLSKYYGGFGDISINKFNYYLLDENTNNVQNSNVINNYYLLNENQFINCLGEKKTRDLNQLLSQQQLELNENDLYQNNYFGVADDASYNAYNSNDQRLYPNEQDISMSLTLLPDVNVDSVEAGVINQYLTAINGFYEKQIQNYTGPQTHSVNDKLEFNNDNLELKKTTFLTYNDDVNNSTNNCYNSITGNEDFNWCGEEPYYKESNF